MADKASQNDKRVTLLKNIIEDLKGDREVWDPLIKAAERYQATLKAVQITSLQFTEALSKIGESASNANRAVNDLGVGIHQIADSLKKVEAKRTEYIKSMLDELILPLQANVKQYEKFAAKFEKEYVKDHKQAVNDLKEAEKLSAKAAKKGADALQQSIQAVNVKVKEMEELRKARLKEAIIEQRKRYCFVIEKLSVVLKSEAEMHDIASTDFRGNLGPWTQLASSPETLPPAVEELVEVQQRTFVPIQSEEGSAANYSDYYSDSGYNTIGRTFSFSSTSTATSDLPSSAPPAPPQLADGVIRAGDNVRGLYDYSGDGEKLGFREGDVISVLEADGSGWCLGELNGVVGWFPGNYVEKIKKPAGPPAPVFSPPAPVFSPPAPVFAPAAPAAPVYNSAPAPAAFAPPTAPKLAPKGPAAPPAPPAPSGAPAPPGPPPPPSFGAGPPPPPAPPAASSGGGGRGALLSSIQQGTQLKKATTNDRSTPKFK